MNIKLLFIMSTLIIPWVEVISQDTLFKKNDIVIYLGSNLNVLNSPEEDAKHIIGSLVGGMEYYFLDRISTGLDIRQQYYRTKYSSNQINDFLESNTYIHVFLKYRTKTLFFLSSGLLYHPRFDSRYAYPKSFREYGLFLNLGKSIILSQNIQIEVGLNGTYLRAKMIDTQSNELMRYTNMLSIHTGFKYVINQKSTK